MGCLFWWAIPWARYAALLFPSVIHSFILPFHFIAIPIPVLSSVTWSLFFYRTGSLHSDQQIASRVHHFRRGSLRGCYFNKRTNVEWRQKPLDDVHAIPPLPNFNHTSLMLYSEIFLEPFCALPSQPLPSQPLPTPPNPSQPLLSNHQFNKKWFVSVLIRNVRTVRKFVL